ncbi:prepilin-type N-terminal cleavage/methylation domain-containing protein [Rummeliibacillus stabekisii]
MKKVMKNEKGVTLIELLAVIVIIAIIALIAVPAIGNIIQNSKDKAILANAQTVLSGSKIAISEGVCGDPVEAQDKKSTSITCDKGTLQPYVDGVSLGANDQVVKKVDDAGKTTYSITYAELGKIKNSKFSNGVTSNVITDDQLGKNMGNK